MAKGKRETILEAARTLFLRDGFASTSVDAVTALAGVSKATVYAHFKNKDDLFASLVAETARPIFDGFPPLEPGGDPAKQLRRYLAAVRAVAFTEGRLWERLAIAEAGRHPAIGRLLHEMGETRVKGAVASYLESIGCPEPPLAAETLLSVAIVGPLRRQLIGVDEPAFADYELGLAALVRAVLRAHPPRAG